MKVRIKVRPAGLINGQEWPEAGEVMDLADAAAEAMIAAGTLEAVQSAPKVTKPKVEKRPAPARGETRKG